MKKTILFGLITSLFLSLGCSPKNEFKAPPPPEVTTQRPTQETVTVHHSFPGRLQAHDHVKIRARVKGFLKSVDFVDGQRVEKGALLFTIEPEEYEAAVQSANASKAQAQAGLKLAEATLKRNEDAFKTKAVSELDVLTAESNKQSAEAKVQSAQAALNKAELDLSYTKIYAPFTGRIGRRMFSAGSLVGSGESTLLTTLVREAPMDVYFNVDERFTLPHLQSGRRGTGETSATPPDFPAVQLELADGSIHSEDGTINYIDNEFDPETGTAQARARFDNAEVKLLPGLYGRILVPKKIKDALLVPDLAVQQDMAGAFVLTVNDEDKVESIYMLKGPLIGTRRVVLKDPTKDRELTTKDRVIINGIQRARPGISVTAKEAALPVAK